MSGPLVPTSSGAAEAREEALMVGKDPGDRRWLGSRVPLVDLERPAEDDAIGPREHVARAAAERILHLRLRLEDRKLAARRVQVLVAEQVATAEPGAVEDQVFGQGRNVGRSGELADLDPPAGDLHVADHLAQI